VVGCGWRSKAGLHAGQIAQAQRSWHGPQATPAQRPCVPPSEHPPYVQHPPPTTQLTEARSAPACPAPRHNSLIDLSSPAPSHPSSTHRPPEVHKAKLLHQAVALRALARPRAAQNEHHLVTGGGGGGGGRGAGGRRRLLWEDQGQEGQGVGDSMRGAEGGKTKQAGGRIKEFAVLTNHSGCSLISDTCGSLQGWLSSAVRRKMLPAGPAATQTTTSCAPNCCTCAY